MRSIWKRRWVVMPVAVAIILAAGVVGAVALADPGSNDSAVPAQLVTATTAQVTGDTTPAAQALGLRKAKLLQQLEQIKRRWAQARTKMTPTDQAAFDQLMQKAKDQRAELQQVRQDLGGTLKQMRALVQKYRPTTTT